VRANVDDEIARAQRGAEDLIRGGNSEFSMTGDARGTDNYPDTENWQKSVGGYQQWNGRFTEVGWAQPFDSSGTVTRTATWQLGDATGATVSDSGSPDFNPGREDREDNRHSGDGGIRPDRNSDTGPPRGR